jgi:methionine salvage enolase-phosphatase E1
MVTTIIKGIANLFRKKNTQQIVAQSKFDIYIILEKLEEILSGGNHFAQAKVITNLKVYLDDDNYDTFIKELRSVNMWGGAGAVWEVYFDDMHLENRFAKEMIGLIDLMKQLGIDFYASNSVKKIFARNL